MLRVPGPYRVVRIEDDRRTPFALVWVAFPDEGVAIECVPPKRYATTNVAHGIARRFNLRWQAGQPPEEIGRYAFDITRIRVVSTHELYSTHEKGTTR